MQIILQEDVEKLGTRGEVVEVAPGYARNYLLPHKLALEASPANIKRLEKIRITLAKRTATEKEAAEQQAALLNQVTVKFSRKTGETDQLFGSVTSADLADALKAQGFEIDKRRIQLEACLVAALGTVVLGAVIATLNASGVDLGIGLRHGLGIGGVFMAMSFQFSADRPDDVSRYAPCCAGPAAISSTDFPACSAVSAGPLARTNAATSTPCRSA